MSRRRKLPHCFYCNEPVTVKAPKSSAQFKYNPPDANEEAALSRIDGSTLVCSRCGLEEATSPMRMFEEWLARGGDRLAAYAFFGRLHRSQNRDGRGIAVGGRA